jgi:DNA-directed RNA polymerase subunit RPC12/RpoP
VLLLHDIVTTETNIHFVHGRWPNVPPSRICINSRNVQRTKSQVPLAARKVLSHNPHMLTAATTPFQCPQCSAKYHIVKIEADLATRDREITCLGCGSPLVGRQGAYFMKYFLVDRPAQQQRMS